VGQLALLGGLDVLEDAGAALPADDEVDDEAAGEPDRAAVAGADVSHHRRHEDRRRGEGAEDRRHRDVRASHPDRKRHAERALGIGLLEAELHDRQLSGGEGH
jgi:hypothetical protein